MFGWKDDNQIYQATNVIEIAKDRDGGVMDYFIPLYYEPETKRLKNYSSENKMSEPTACSTVFLTPAIPAPVFPDTPGI